MTNTILGVLIGAVASLGGVGITQWFAARQRERERYMQLRRDIYIDAADGLGSLLEYAGAVGRADVPLGSATPKEHSGWLLKLYLIAGADTVIAFNEAHASVMAAALDVFSARMSVAQIEDEIALVRSNIDRIQSFQAQLRDEARSLIAVSGTPPEQLMIMVRRLESIREQLDTSTSDINDLAPRLERLTTEHGLRVRMQINRAIRAAMSAQRPIRAALLAARSELEFSIETDKLAKAASKLDDAITSKLGHLLDEFLPAPQAADGTTGAGGGEGKQKPLQTPS